MLEAGQVMLLLSRLQQDHDNQPSTMRKACTEKQAVAKHQVCGAFLHFLDEFSKVCPAGEFKGISKNLHTQFQSGYMDPDLAHCLETQVPPGDMSAITSFRLSDGRASLDG